MKLFDGHKCFDDLSKLIQVVKEIVNTHNKEVSNNQTTLNLIFIFQRQIPVKQAVKTKMYTNKTQISF